VDRELDWKASFAVGCAIAVVLSLAVGSWVVWTGRKAEDEKKRRTQRCLEADELCLKQLYGTNPPRANGAGEDWSGMKTLVGTAGKFEWELKDGWGNPLIYRRPGPVHTKGWDLWSCGPNGKDDQGTFDDILVGEDLPEGSK
jgi:hypothetical protein